MQVRALGTYEFPLKSLVLAKSSGNRLAAVHLGTLLRDADMLHGMQIDYIVSIPLHWSRLAWRGYNQADEIARVLAKKLGKPHIHALTRTTATPFQSRVHVTERARNVAHAFRVSARHKAQLKGARILLVDDLMTTGATLKSAARTLHFDCKPASIAAIVACRTL